MTHMSNTLEMLRGIAAQQTAITPFTHAVIAALASQFHWTRARAHRAVHGVARDNIVRAWTLGRDAAVTAQHLHHAYGDDRGSR